MNDSCFCVCEHRTHIYTVVMLIVVADFRPWEFLTGAASIFHLCYSSFSSFHQTNSVQCILYTTSHTHIPTISGVYLIWTEYHTHNRIVFTVKFLCFDCCCFQFKKWSILWTLEFFSCCCCSHWVCQTMGRLINFTPLHYHSLFRTFLGWFRCNSELTKLIYWIST